MSGNEFTCECCGAPMQFAAGEGDLACTACGARQDILEPVDEVRAYDLNEILLRLNRGDGVDAEEVLALKCGDCGAEATLPEIRPSDACPFCGATRLEAAAHADRLRPGMVVPFAVDRAAAFKRLRKWLGRRWLAPTGLHVYLGHPDALDGVYLPFWVFDADSETRFKGERYSRDDDEHFEDGVTGQKWRSVSGEVTARFDSLLIPASDSVPRALLDEIGPWPLDDARPYQPAYLAGFVSERYRLSLGAARDEARAQMNQEIDRRVAKVIGGDRRRVLSKSTAFSEETFRHALLPAWIGVYRYRDRIHRVVVSGVTGKVAGDRSRSAGKVAMATLAGLAVLLLAVAVVSVRG